MIKRKWPKIDRGGPRAPSGAKESAGGLRLGPPLVSWPVPSLRSPPGRAGARGQVRERSACMAPGCAPLSEDTTGAEKGDKILKAEGWKDFRASGGHPAPARPLFAAESGLTLPPWLGCRKWGPKGSLEPAGWPSLARKSFQPSAFRILSPFSALVVYSESGAQPSAIQTLLSRTRLRAPARPGCRAPREAWRLAELPTALPGGERRLGTGRETSGGPSRSPPALPFASEGARGPPRSIFGHFLLIKKVAAGWPPLALTLAMVKEAKAGAPLNLG